MRLPFRQGLVRYQTDLASNPTFLAPSNGGTSIDLVVSPDPTIMTFAHRAADYLFEENATVNNAWQGPFVSGTTYWLYFDLDIITSKRTFGHTTLEPTFGPNAPSPAPNLHWFDTKETVMKVWNGITWQETIRVFAGKYKNGSILIANPYGSQVGLTQVTHSGFVLFDDEERPVRKFNRGRRSEFLTTESVLASHFSTGAINFAFETALNFVEAVEPIPQYHLVTSKGINQIGVASYTNSNVPIIGMVREDVTTGQFVSYIPRGIVTNESWNWSANPGTPLFCGATGEVTLSVPQTGSIQEVGYVMSSTTIFLNIQQMIVLENA